MDTLSPPAVRFVTCKARCFVAFFGATDIKKHKASSDLWVFTPGVRVEVIQDPQNVSSSCGAELLSINNILSPPSVKMSHHIPVYLFGLQTFRPTSART